jgi:hypothetical protein
MIGVIHFTCGFKCLQNTSDLIIEEFYIRIVDTQKLKHAILLAIRTSRLDS